MNRTRFAILLSLPLAIAVWAVACSSDDTGGTPTGTTTGAGSGGTGAGGGNGTGGLNLGGSQPGGCTTSADCDGGVCVNGVCCDSAEDACGNDCCTGGEVCVFDECVTPGDPCRTEADCPDGSYCEPALGDDVDGGVVDAGPDAVCTAPTPVAGRCLPLPPVCGEDGAGGGCIEPCEYHPPVGALNAVVEWQWGYDPAPTEYTGRADVWSTPTVARIYDSNCDGKVDTADPPQMVFVSANTQGTCCQCGACACGANCATEPSCCQTGVLRMLDGATGQEIWSLAKAKSGAPGFAAMTVAIGDVDGDQSVDIVALTGDGYVALIDAWGNVQAISDARVPDWNTSSFGWGGGLSLGDMDGDGLVEIAFAHTLFTWDGTHITRAWVGAYGTGGAVSRRMSHFVDLDLDGDLELLAGNTPYQKDGTPLWPAGTIASLPDNFTAIGDFDKNGTPEVVFIHNGQAHIVNGADGTYFNGWSPFDIIGSGNGGPPTVADFDGDGYPEIGVALQNFYSVLKPDFVAQELTELWHQTTHDFSSGVTGSSVFDFEGDGKAEVVYNDECFQWVYDGTDGSVLLVSYTQSFTATEASMVADVDGDGHAELVIMANGANPTTWHCAHHTQDQTPISPHTVPLPIWEPPTGASDYRGITVLGDAQNSWVGTRTLWNQHPYSVTNICDPRDSACAPGSYYGQIPSNQQKNWQLDWLNNFRQNVQDDGLFDAPDAVVTLRAECVDPVPMQVSVRNVGLSGLPAGIDVEVVKTGSPEVRLGIVTTTIALMPGQTQVLPFTAQAGEASTSDTFVARILISDPPTFHECREDNNESPPVSPECVQ